MVLQQVVLFVDAQNFYNGARRAFFDPSDSHVLGQFDPIKLGELICSRPPPGFKRSLREVRIYTGRPDGSLEPKTYAAHIKQCLAWEKAGAKVIPRPLQYLSDWPSSKPQQKGIDVALAIDFIALAIDGEYNVGIIASTDTDLNPALEFVYQRYYPKCLPEVANWSSPAVDEDSDWNVGRSGVIGSKELTTRPLLTPQITTSNHGLPLSEIGHL